MDYVAELSLVLALFCSLAHDISGFDPPHALAMTCCLTVSPKAMSLSDYGLEPLKP